jgi:hypothetical protein
MYINAKHSKKLGANGDAGGDGVDGMLGGLFNLCRDGGKEDGSIDW